MEKLIVTSYGEETAILRKSTENPDIQHRNSKYQSKKVLASILLTLIILPESLIYSGNVKVALLLYVGILVVISLVSIFVKEQKVRNIYQAFLLLPILRLMNFSVPMFPEIPLLSFVFIYAPMIIPLTIVINLQNPTNERLGLSFRNLWYYLPAAIFIGFTLGQAEAFIVQATPLIPDLSLVNILLLAAVMIFFVGFTEELLFRSVLQTSLEEVFGSWNGLILSSLIFGLMNFGYGALYEIFYAFFVGLLLGYTFQRTRSLPFIALVHGFISVFSFGVFPHLGNLFSFL
ncbi:CAAX amino terminal protease family protein [Methanosarcina horonobensis HB-1 = JCM 15518]|uniref:CAAX amino terminal protease family protein n=1 Tax=Methanosarcina horonobensis HB-1 = JCM 15518 TaxID=1434110 RepID=A0A0E3SCL1_9EURY|nr:type II CAAX endopeptidase family protein [Methanosarcina horonobensis]AKB79714.1 CAAX amino terminal protease family protein [Methanosarcina horonobensis HB-1 = JCM 15518]